MADLNIRNVEPELIANLRQEALGHKQSLRGYVTFILANRGRITGQPEPESAGLRNRVAEKLAEQAVASTSKPHNPKTCRVYKCGMCASLKA